MNNPSVDAKPTLPIKDDDHVAGPDSAAITVVAYCDSTIAFPLFCEYAVGSANGRRTRKDLVHKRDQLVATLTQQAKAARDKRAEVTT